MATSVIDLGLYSPACLLFIGFTPEKNNLELSQQDGHTFEKAGVNVSVVHGIIPAAAVAQMNARGKKLPEGRNKLSP